MQNCVPQKQLRNRVRNGTHNGQDITRLVQGLNNGPGKVHRGSSGVVLLCDKELPKDLDNGLKLSNFIYSFLGSGLGSSQRKSVLDQGWLYNTFYSHR